jgi:hypothetical protein
MTPLEEADELIDNWRIYFRDTHHKRRTFSLEGLYIPERVDEDDNELPPKAMKPVDHKKAIAIEKIVISFELRYKLPLAVETFYRFVLKSNHSFYTTCRKNKLNPRNWDEDYRAAKLMVRNRYLRNI